MTYPKRESRLKRFFKKFLPGRYKSVRTSRISVYLDDNNSPPQRDIAGPNEAHHRVRARGPRPAIHHAVKEQDLSCRQPPGRPQTEVNLPQGWEPLICRVDSGQTTSYRHTIETSSYPNSSYPKSIQAVLPAQHIHSTQPRVPPPTFSIPRKPRPYARYRVDPPLAAPFVPVPGWDEDWDKPLGLRTGPHKAIWKTPSFRLEIRNKRSIRKMEAEARIRETMEHTQALQMRSMRSVEEMVEEERRASREFFGQFLSISTIFVTCEVGGGWGESSCRLTDTCERRPCGTR